MTWDYRIIHHDKGKYSYFAIHEVFYDEDSKITSWTAEPIDVTGENQLEVITTLKQMLKDTSNTEVLLESHIEKIVRVIL